MKTETLPAVINAIKLRMPLIFVKKNIRSWYIHLILEHLEDIIKDHDSLSLYSNQGDNCTFIIHILILQ